MGVTPDGDTEAIIAGLTSFRQRLIARLAEAEIQIVARMEATIAEEYPEKLAAKWEEIPNGPIGTVLSSVTVGTDAKEVYGWEYGVGGRRIVPTSAGGKLYFFWQKVGQNVAFASVNWPGFAGHDKRDIIKTALETEAPIAWAAAIEEVLAAE